MDTMSNDFAGVGRQIDGMQQQISGVQDVLSRRLAKVEKEQKECQHMAAKALTATELVSKEVATLEARITAIEQGNPPRNPSGQTASQNSGYEQLRGNKGTEVVMTHGAIPRLD